VRVERSGGESTWARAGLNKGSAASNHVLTDHSGLINVMLAGGRVAFGRPFQDEVEDPSRFNAGAEETCPHASGAQEREVDWLLQKPEFCVIIQLDFLTHNKKMYEMYSMRNR
jgi:hypothetical protein